MRIYVYYTIATLELKGKQYKLPVQTSMIYILQYLFLDVCEHLITFLSEELLPFEYTFGWLNKKY